MKPLKTRERKHLCRINKLHSPTLRQPWRLKCLISVIYTIKALHCGNYLARSSIYAHVYSISCSLGCFFNRLGCTQIREWKRSGSKQGISKEEIFLGFFFFCLLAVACTLSVSPVTKQGHSYLLLFSSNHAETVPVKSVPCVLWSN